MLYISLFACIYIYVEFVSHHLTRDLKFDRHSIFFQIHVRQAPGRDIPFFDRIYVCVCLYIVSCPLIKRNPTQTWNLAHTFPISKNFFFFFSKKLPQGPLASKNCRVTWISAYLFDCFVNLFFENSDSECRELQKTNSLHSLAFGTIVLQKCFIKVFAKNLI